MAVVPDTATPTRVTAVPRRMRILCGAVAVFVVVLCVVGGVFLKSSSTPGVMEFRTSDQVAVAVLGVLVGVGVLLLARPRVDADVSGIRVRNILATHVLPWTFVRSLRFDPSSPWATLFLENGEELAVLALQATDKERAAVAVEGLRALLLEGKPAPAPRPPLLYDD
jgi:hypothetical protein